MSQKGFWACLRKLLRYLDLFWCRKDKQFFIDASRLKCLQRVEIKIIQKAVHLIETKYLAFGLPKT